MHRVNAGFTLLLPLVPDRVDAASALLAELDADQARVPFARSATTHFATITVIPAQKYRDELLPALLLFATSFCGPTRVHVAELVRIMGAGLRAIFAHTRDFDPACSDADLETFMLEHRRGDAFYSGMQHLSPEDVRRHRELRDAIQTFLDGHELPREPLEARRRIQAYVRSRRDLAWASDPWAPSFYAWLVFNRRVLLVEAGVAALLVATVARLFVDNAMLSVVVWSGWVALGAFLLFVILMVVTIRCVEDKQSYISERAPDNHARMLAATQARPVINEFTLAGGIKDEGDLRPVFLQILVWIMGRGVEGIPGIRAGLNIPTVATARWIAADDGRRAVFISNYTNSGEGYVRDFIETPDGAQRINLSFGFGRGFPKTRWIVNDGALAAPNEYLYSLAENQLKTLFWYGPYRDLSIDNIKVNRKIREGLFADLDEKEAREWLYLL